MQVHGHRGARARRPENTLEAFRYAIAAGVDFLEMDVVMTRDEIPVIHHDPVLRSGAAIRALPLAELRRADPTIPLLDEVLALEGAGFNIEIKSGGDPPPEQCAALLLEAIRRHRVAPRAIVQSFDFRVLHAMRPLAPEIRLAALVEEETPDFVAVTRRARADILAPEFSMVTVERVAQAAKAGIPVVPWTVNTKEDWDRLVAAGVSGIITDDPAALIAWLQLRGLR